MGMGIGDIHLGTGISGFRGIPGGICPISAACGTGMTRLAGVGRLEWVVAIPGGMAVEATMVPTLAQDMAGIALRCVPIHPDIQLAGQALG